MMRAFFRRHSIRVIYGLEELPGFLRELPGFLVFTIGAAWPFLLMCSIGIWLMSAYPLLLIAYVPFIILLGAWILGE